MSQVKKKLKVALKDSQFIKTELFKCRNGDFP